MTSAIPKIEYNQDLVHQLIVTYQNNARQWSKKTKTRSEVNGGGKKPWRQKGTGRARAGTTRGPIWRGGGVTFAHTPGKSMVKINKKMYRKGMLCLLSSLDKEKRIHIIDEVKLKDHKTKTFLEAFKDKDLYKSVIIVNEFSENVILSTNNVHTVCVVDPILVDPLLLADAKNIYVEKKALDVMLQRYQND
jgi:large subunit ribosomal protein L4